MKSLTTIAELGATSAPTPGKPIPGKPIEDPPPQPTPQPVQEPPEEQAPAEEGTATVSVTQANPKLSESAAISANSSLTVHLPVDARGVSLTILATVALIYALDWAQPFFISLMLGVLIAYTLNPLVVWLEHIKIPRVMGATIVTLGVVAILGLGAYSLRGQVQTILEQLPVAANKISEGLGHLRKGAFSNVQNVQAAASTLEKATTQADQATVKPRATHVVIDQPTFKLSNFLWMGSRGLLTAFGQLTMVLFLVFFFLCGGDLFKRKLVHLTGPTLTKKRITVAILDDINDSIQKYMFMLLLTNALVGLLTWLALEAIGLDNAGAWAVAAALLHLIPYAGPAITAGVLGTVGFMQFNSFSMGLLAAGASLTVATLIGTFVTTWMTGRFARMNTAAVFVSLLFWAWLWGVWGMLLGIPIIVIIKVISQHIEQLHPLAELLSE